MKKSIITMILLLSAILFAGNCAPSGGGSTVSGSTGGTSGGSTDAEAVAADKVALGIIYNGTDSAGSVTRNVGLNTTGSGGTTITWASDNTAIATNGTVTRPTPGTGNVVVTLTATITKNAAIDSKIFSLTVIEGDSIAPTPGNTGIMTAAGNIFSSVILNWTSAADNISASINLCYTIYQSATNNIDSLVNILANGIAINPVCTMNMNSYNIGNSYNISGISNTANYINVIVLDEAGNKAAYQMYNLCVFRCDSLYASNNTTCNGAYDILLCFGDAACEATTTSQLNACLSSATTSYNTCLAACP
ncbi:MAG: hypothetical protein OEV66_05930 [Spirochaetia bacterium]|nr:hypothetical protein [Spirochaetia bacterium]